MPMPASDVTYCQLPPDHAMGTTSPFRPLLRMHVHCCDTHQLGACRAKHGKFQTCRQQPCSAMLIHVRGCVTSGARLTACKALLVSGQAMSTSSHAHM
jgi:hypothetical protein